MPSNDPPTKRQLSTRRERRVARRKYLRRRVVLGVGVVAAVVLVVVGAIAFTSGTSKAKQHTSGTHTTASQVGLVRHAPPAPPTTSDLAAPKPANPVAMPPGVQVISRVPTTDRVVFLTIDDGLVRNPEFTQRFKAAGVPVTIFPIAGSAVKVDPQFFKDWLALGAALGDHTMTHPNLNTLGEAGQQQQICGAADLDQQLLGVRPTILRPPYGNHNAATATAAAACGMRYIVLWHEAVNNGKVQFQEGSALQTGDIILMHFRTTFDEDFDAALAQARKDGMKLALLSDYLPA